MAARDLDFIEEVLAGPDMRVRRSALRAVRTLPVPDPAVRAALDDAPAELRRALYRTLAHARRHALLPDVRARWGDREAAALLPACGSAAVARWLPELAHAVTSWTTMAKRHAGAIMAVAEQELATGVHPLTWWRRRGAGVELAALSEPDRMLALLDRYDLGHVLAQLPGAVANALFRADAVRARRLFIDGAAPLWEEPPKALLRHVSSASDAELLRLASVDYHFDTVLRRLPPARRAAIFEAAAQRQGGGSRLWAMRLLRWLPPERAAAEARRLLEWHASVRHAVRSHLDDPDIPLELTSHLPYEEAVGPLREAAVEGDSRRRGLARTLLVRCTARTRDRALLHALLAELALRTVNERDPLRRDLLTALLELPPALLDDSFAATLGRAHPGPPPPVVDVVIVAFPAHPRIRIIWTGCCAWGRSTTFSWCCARTCGRRATGGTSPWRWPSPTRSADAAGRWPNYRTTCAPPSAGHRSHSPAKPPACGCPAGPATAERPHRRNPARVAGGRSGSSGSFWRSRPP